MSRFNNDPLEDYHTKDGLIWKGDEYLREGAADQLAHSVGLPFAESVVEVLKFRSTPAGACFQRRLNATGPDYYGLNGGKQRVRVEKLVSELFYRQERGVW